MDESAFLSGYAAKAAISVNLDRVFGAQELDFMLFFSSLVSFVKTPGQCNYAAGCTFEDAFAQKLQHERGYPVRIMNWGYWGGVGVAADEAYTKRMAQIGLGSIEPLEGMAALEMLVGSDVPQMACVKTLVTAATAGLSLSEAMVLLSSKKAAPRAAGAAALSGDPIRDYVGRVMIEKVSEALRLEPAEIGSDTPLNEYGVDSISGVILVRAINDALQIEVEPSKLLDYRTVDELAEYIADNWREHLKEQMAEQMAALSADPAIAPLQDVDAIANVIAGAAERLLLNETAETEMSGEQALESVLWQDVPAADSYEKVTF
jgi:polyketide synthase PksM